MNQPFGVAISNSEPVAWERGSDGKLRATEHEVWLRIGPPAPPNFDEWLMLQACGRRVLWRGRPLTIRIELFRMLWHRMWQEVTTTET